MSNTFIEWFGDDFHRLHPSLQKLHVTSGTLEGKVTIATSRSWFGRWLGNKLARKMGVPTNQSQRVLKVIVAHHADGLHWGRDFSEGEVLTSHFVPQGTKQSGGYILETTGRLKAKLTVDIVDGAWIWRPLSMMLGRIRLPIWLFPKSHAYKRVNTQGLYHFSVSFSIPFIGQVLSYSGQLKQLQ